MKQKILLLLFPGILLFLLLISCKSENLEQKPVEVVWDRDLCEVSGMVLSDRRFAVQIIEPDGKAYFFIDIGLAVQWLKDKKWEETAKIWVMDVYQLNWIEAKKANWLVGTHNTPMGFGYSATINLIKNSLDFDTVKRKINTLKNKKRERNRGVR